MKVSVRRFIGDVVCRSIEFPKLIKEKLDRNNEPMIYSPRLMQPFNY